MSSIAASLYAKFHIFNYVTEYVRKHETIAPPSQFEVSDELFADFAHYLSDKDYAYSTITERVIKELRKVAEEEKYIGAISSQLDAMEEQFRKDKERDLYRYRDEISEMLKSEILTRYYYERGRIEGNLSTDPDVTKAVEVMSDRKGYNKLLGKK